MREYKVNEQLLNTVIQYLASKPYWEVYQLVAELQKVEQIKEETLKSKK